MPDPQAPRGIHLEDIFAPEDDIFGVAVVRDEYGFTEGEKRLFLQYLSETANVIQASKALAGKVLGGYNTTSVIRNRLYKLRFEDEEFRARWDAAVQLGIEAQEDEMRRRAFKGVNKPVFYQGAVVGTVREYSDTLAMFMMKAAKPEKYRERVEIEQHVESTLKNASDADLNRQIIEGLARLGVRIRDVQTFEHQPQHQSTDPSTDPADALTAGSNLTSLPPVDPRGSHAAFFNPVRLLAGDVPTPDERSRKHKGQI